ncbi:dienelactone hydrolase family protein [Actinacidiphila reveromycinica]|uniref:dienelactone hydrolase family protein n=1 Tax=Actinacidiphila reveromycinica TaxID=659352 RepID=UPI0019231709|nr:dienelactone hydrolase family protein [Streptomyces sp. SN-593]
MRTETLYVPTEDGRADAFAAFPQGGGRHPGVLMYADVFGIRPATREMACELAGHGYCVLVPNFLYRHGPTPLVDLPAYISKEARPAIVARLMPAIEAHTGDQARRDAAAYLAFLGARPEVSAGPVAVTGYCVGGLLAMRAAATHPGRVAAVAGFHNPVGPVAAFHGPLGDDGPGSLPGFLAGLTAEVHLGHAESDMTPAALDGLNRVLDEAGTRHTSEIHPGTVHGFTMSDTHVFDPAATRRHWDRLLDLLDRTLRGDAPAPADRTPSPPAG